MLKKFFLTSLLSALFLYAVAQEYWIQPEKFTIKTGEKLVAAFSAGENFMRESWNLDKSDIDALQLHQLSMVISLKDSVKNTEKDFSYTVKNEGTCLLAMQTANVLLESDADKFNEFLKQAGLDDALYQRRQKNALTSLGKEYYAVYTKLLVQVGQKRDYTYSKVLGFPAEIIPLQNPYAFKIGEKVRFKILFDGKPVFGARVKVWNRSPHRTTIQNIYTEKDGTIEAIISNSGSWMVTVVNMVPSKQAGAEWQSYRASLVFGIDK